jgi:hypothetical protein
MSPSDTPSLEESSDSCPKQTADLGQHEPFLRRHPVRRGSDPLFPFFLRKYDDGDSSFDVDTATKEKCQEDTKLLVIFFLQKPCLWNLF